jgi:hypothetical protein
MWGHKAAGRGGLITALFFGTKRRAYGQVFQSQATVVSPTSGKLRLRSMANTNENFSNKATHVTT